MKTRSLHLASVILSLSFLLGGCGGDGGGGGGGGPTPPTPLATGTFIKTANTTTYSTYVSVFNDTYSYYRTQNVYTANTIKASGRITGLSLLYNSTVASPITCPTVTIKMGHTLLSALTITFADNHSHGQGSQTTVLSNGTVTIPAGVAGDWLEITFPTPFEYNGVDNLVVDIERSAYCSGDFREWVAPLQPSGTSVLQTWNSPVGILQTWLPITRFHFSGGDNAQDYGSGENNYWPFSMEAPLRTQNLYLASDIHGSGPITGVAFQMNAVSSAGMFTYTMTLSHATVTTLNATFANNYSGTQTTVASAVTFTVPAGIPAGEWFWVPVPSGTFIYNGTDNLIVEVSTTAGTADEDLRATYIAGRRVWADGATTATGSVDDTAYHVKLRFNGGTMDTIVAGGTYEAYPFNSSASPKRQYLYPAAVLGTKASIHKVAFRLHFDPAADTYDNVEIVMGHAVLSSLTTTFADNMTDAAIVYNGPVSIPAGKKAGDWIEIPLGTAFAYDGVRNLVVQIAADAGSATNYLTAYGPSSRYTGYRLVWDDRTSATGQLANYLASQRLWVTKY